MKNLVLTSSFPKYKGDADGPFIYDLSKLLIKNGVEVIVLCPHYPGAKLRDIMGGLKVYRFPYFYPLQYQKLCGRAGIFANFKESYLAKIQLPLLFLFELFFAIKIIRKEKIDIIHTHWVLPSGLVGAICRKIFKVPHIATVHGSDVNTIKQSKILRRICSFILQNSDRITTNSSYTKSITLSIDIKSKNKVDVIPMGIDINRFKSEGTTNLKEVFDVEYLILSVCILIDWKGTKYLIIAMKEVIKKFPNAKLVIGGNGPEKGKLEKLTKELNLENTVIFTGYIEDIDLPKYYSSADVFVLPSINLNGLTEGLGVVLLEAMACGTPVIGSNVGGVPDIIKDGYNGFLVPEKSPEDLADKIIELLSNRKLAKEFSVNGLKTVKERFSGERVSEQFMSIYEEVKNENWYRSR
jgi:N-acetyl-alpha-D-glucosaminyl L-malate synthase BshA